MPVRWVLTLFALFLLWSNSFHAIAWLQPKMSAWELVALRFAPVGVFCAVWLWVREPRETWTLLRAHPWRVAAMGALMVPVYNVALNWGQARVPAGTASLLIAFNPVFTYALAIWVGQERLLARKALGFTLALVAIALLLRFQGRAFGTGYLWSALSVLTAPLAWAWATVLGRPLVQREPPLRVTYAALAIGSLPFALWTLVDPAFPPLVAALAPADWVALAHLSILCTIVGFAVWYAALRRVSASSVAAFVLLNPPLTVLFGPLWGTDRPSWPLIAFGTVVLAGIGLAITGEENRSWYSRRAISPTR